MPCLLFLEESPIDYGNEDHFVIFTDGAKNSRDVGAAWCLFGDGKLMKSTWIKLPSVLTSFDAELIAVESAVEHCIANSIPSTHIVLDCLAVLLALKNRKTKDERAIYIAALIAKAWKEHVLFTFKWVNGHKNCIGNILADANASEAINSGSPRQVNISSRTAKKLLALAADHRWTITAMSNWHTYRGLFPVPVDRRFGKKTVKTNISGICPKKWAIHLAFVF